MSGWERTGTDDAPVWRLEWDHRPGLTVRCTVPSLRARSLAARVGPLLAGGLDKEYRLLLALAEVFGDDCLISWNVRWGGRPVPASGEGMARLDLPLVAEILATWIGAWTPPEPEAEAEAEEDFSILDDLAVELAELDAAVQDEGVTAGA